MQDRISVGSPRKRSLVRRRPFSHLRAPETHSTPVPIPPRATFSAHGGWRRKPSALSTILSEGAPRISLSTMDARRCPSGPFRNYSGYRQIRFPLSRIRYNFPCKPPC